MNTPTTLVVIDLDRTLFDTARNFNDFMDMLKAVYGNELINKMKEVEATTQHFDRFAYLQAHHGLRYGQLVADFRSFVSRTYGENHSYLFPGATKLIAFLQQEPHTHLLIITTGSGQSQRFKLGLCPELAGLPHKIIGHNKGAALQAEFDAASAVSHDGRHFNDFVFIDDKADAIAPIQPAPNRLLIHLLREGAKYPELTERNDVHIVHSLEDVYVLLQKH